MDQQYYQQWFPSVIALSSSLVVPGTEAVALMPGYQVVGISDFPTFYLGRVSLGSFISVRVCVSVFSCAFLESFAPQRWGVEVALEETHVHSTHRACALCDNTRSAHQVRTWQNSGGMHASSRIFLHIKACIAAFGCIYLPRSSGIDLVVRTSQGCRSLLQQCLAQFLIFFLQYLRIPKNIYIFTS